MDDTTHIEKYGEWELYADIENSEITYMGLKCPGCKMTCEEFIVVHSDMDKRYPQNYEDVKEVFLEEIEEEECGYCDLEYPNGMKG